MLGWLSSPPASVVPAQVKLLKLSTRAILFPADPAVLAVTVTTAPLAVAVTDETFRLIASFRLVASVVVSPEVAKLVPVFVPSAPPLSEVAPLSHVKPAVKVFPRPILLPAVPFVVAVTVTVLVPPVEAVTPRAGKAVLQRLITEATFVATVVVVLLV